MAIGNAVQRGHIVYVYDLRGKSLFVKSGRLYGFTSTTVAMQIGRLLVTYGESGRQLAAILA